MPVSNELINSTVSDIGSKVPDTFAYSNRFLKRLKEKSLINTYSTGGTYVERAFMGGSPTTGVGLFSGDEVAPLTRVQQARKYSVEYHAVFAAISIPGKEIRQNNGKTGAWKLINQYPISTLNGWLRDWNSYWLTGVSTGFVLPTAQMAGFTTLNGQFSAGVGQGVTNGLLDFRTPAQQLTDAENVQNVVKSTVYWHFNRYFPITAFATDGETTLRRAYRNAAHSAMKPEGGPDLVVMDDQTFGNYELVAKKDLIQIRLVSDKTETTNTLTNTFMLAQVYSDLDLDLANFTGVAAAGVTYMLNTDFFEMCQIEELKIGKFEDRLADQDALVAKMLGHFQVVCTNFPAQACVSGGST